LLKVFAICAMNRLVCQKPTGYRRKALDFTAS
jgi:hypothetical protein